MAQFHALLVGINNYKAEKLKNYSLQGCLNDVRRVSAILNQMFPGQLQECVLTEDRATRTGIIESFRTQLIEPARQWVASGRLQPEPAFLFHFSGHGSLARDVSGTKPSGFDETIVPYDSRQADIFDLRDWELGILIDGLGEFTTNITIVLDCCHSGSGTRSSGRMCEPDLRIAPPDLQTIRRSNAKGLRCKSDSESADYVLLAACDSKQIAEEYHDSSSGTAIVYGALTYALTEVLGSLPSMTVTYRELYELIRAKVRLWYPAQSPQCEGARERIIFSTEQSQRDLLFSVIELSADEYTIDAGQIHGFSAGDEFDVYPPQSRTLATAGRSAGRLRVLQAGVVTSRCLCVSGQQPIIVRSRLKAVLMPTVATDSPGLAKQYTTLEIRNPQPSSLQGLIVCELQKLKSSNPAQVFEYEPMKSCSDGVLRVVSGTPVCIAVQNNSARPVFVQILSLGYDGSVSRIWPKLTGEQVALVSGRTFQTNRFRLMFHPDDKTSKTAHEFVKVFAATVPMDIDMLCTGNRSSEAAPTFSEEWTTSELMYEIIREESNRDLQARIQT